MSGRTRGKGELAGSRIVAVLFSEVAEEGEEEEEADEEEEEEEEEEGRCKTWIDTCTCTSAFTRWRIGR